MDSSKSDSFKSDSSVPSNHRPMPPRPLPQDTPQVKEEKSLANFWYQQSCDNETRKGKPQELVPARIKKIMKADKNVKLISSGATEVLAKVCEVFIQELTFRGWIIAEHNKKLTLNHCHVSMAVKKDEIFNFLANVPDCGHAHHDDEVNAGNIMTNVGHLIARNQDMIARNQDVIERNKQMLMMQAPYLPYYDHESAMMEPQYLQSQMMQPPHLPSDQSQTQTQTEMMQQPPPYYPSDQSETVQPPPYLPSGYPYPYNIHPK